MQHKLARTSMIYMILGLAFGLFDREFARIYDFTGYTQLGVLHTHFNFRNVLFLNSINS